MKSDRDNKYIFWGITAFIVVALSILFYYTLFNFATVTSGIGHFFGIIMPIVDGFIIAYILTPLINFIENLIYKRKNYNTKQKRRVRVITIIFTVLLLIFAIYEFFALIIPEVSKSILNIIDNYEVYSDNLEKRINSLIKKYPDLSKELERFMNNYSGKIRDYSTNTLLPKVQDGVVALTSGVFTAIKAVWNLILGLIISVYFLYNKELFAAQGKKLIYAIFKRDRANTFIHNIRFTNKTFNGFIVGKIVDSIIIGILCYILTLFIGTPYPVLVSVIVGVTNIIPFFGPFIGAIPCILLILLVDPVQCLYFIIMIFALQQFDGNILGPKILGSSTGLSGFWVIFSITLFGGIWGVVGMLIGVPLFAVIYAGIRAYVKTSLESKKLSVDTAVYMDVDFIDKQHNYVSIPKEQISEITSTQKTSRRLFDRIRDRINFSDDDNTNDVIATSDANEKNSNDGNVKGSDNSDDASDE